jgi:hypothetical protein
MGFIQDILKADKDGQLKRHIFRTLTIGVYGLLLVGILLVSGVVWRVFSGSEVEVFGLKISGSAKDASAGQRTARPPDGKQDTAGSSPASAGDKANPPAAGTQAASQPSQAWRDIKLNTSWYALPHGDFATCLQDSREIFSQLRLSELGQAGATVWATQKSDGQTIAQISLRCMDLNGISIAFAVVYGQADAAITALSEKVSQEFVVRSKGAIPSTLGGAGHRAVVGNGWVATNIANVEQCRKTAGDVLTALKARNIVSTVANFTFAVIDSMRVSIVCAPITDGTMTTYSVAGFNDVDTRRLLDRMAAAYQPYRQTPAR